MNRRQLLKNSLFAGFAVAIGFKAKEAAATPRTLKVYETIGPMAYNKKGLEALVAKMQPLGGEVHILIGRPMTGKTTALARIAEAHLSADPENTVWILDTEGHPWSDKVNVINGQGSIKQLDRLTTLYLSHENAETVCSTLIETIKAQPKALILIDMLELLMGSPTRVGKILQANRFGLALSRMTGKPVIRSMQSHRESTPKSMNVWLGGDKIVADSIVELGDPSMNKDLGIHVGTVYRTPKEIGSPAWATYRLIAGLNPPTWHPMYVSNLSHFAAIQDA